MRTDKEKSAFAKTCLEIEKQGGNVQEYIAKNWPSYTPRATWYLLQKMFLGRKACELTEGKPTINSDGKEVNTVRTKRDRNKVLEEVLKVIEEHGDPVAWFMNEGYEAPIAGWQALRKWTEKNRPDDYKKLPQDLRKYYAENGIKRRGQTDDEPKTSETTPVPKEAVESVFFGGKEYEKMDNPSPTCCQPAKPSGVTVPDELPKEEPAMKAYPGPMLQVCAILSNVVKTTRYENSTLHAGSIKYMDYVYRDEVTKEERHLNLSADTWARLALEIPQALRQLGLSK